MQLPTQLLVQRQVTMYNGAFELAIKLTTQKYTMLYDIKFPIKRKAMEQSLFNLSTLRKKLKITSQQRIKDKNLSL
jgi:hypothetical protein